ncbi:MAG: metallophosphoesterase family protein [Desulfitobacteriaceae bacterium]
MKSARIRVVFIPGTLSLILGLVFFLTLGPKAEFAAQQGDTWGINQGRTVDVLAKPQPKNVKLRFLVISDIHVQPEDQFAQERLKLVLDDLAYGLDKRTDALVINGDLGDGKAEDYATIKHVLSEGGPTVKYPPILYNIGNHEFYQAYHVPTTNVWSPETFPNGDTDENAIKRYLAFTGEDHVYYDRYLKGYHFIFLGSERSRMSNPSLGDAAYLSEKQVSWLKSKLQANYVPHKPIFVFLHQPILTAAGWGKSHLVIQQDELRALFQKYPEVVLFSGHLHAQLGTANTMLQDQYTIFNDSSPCRTRDAGFKIATDKSEGLLVDVLQNNVVVKGRDFLNHGWVKGIEYEVPAR